MAEPATSVLTVPFNCYYNTVLFTQLESDALSAAL